jgi:hypothetical protein
MGKATDIPCFGRRAVEVRHRRKCRLRRRLALPFSIVSRSMPAVGVVAGDVRVSLAVDRGRGSSGTPHSTVTDFARLRGWSTLAPRLTAM